MPKVIRSGVTCIEPPKPRGSWGVQHFGPYPMWVRDMETKWAYKFYFPPENIKWSKQINFPTVPVGGILAKPVEFTSGEPYLLSFQTHLIVEPNYSGYAIYTNHGVQGGITENSKTANWSAEQIHAMNESHYSALVQGGQEDNLQFFLIELKKIVSHKLRILMASAEVDDASHTKDMFNIDMMTGSVKTEVYSVVLESLDYEVKARHHINALPTYVVADWKFKQR